MPDGGRGNRGPCGGRRRRGTRLLLRPSLLLLLAENKSHGYDMYDQLKELGFDPDCLDSSIIYRDLRDMEDQGWINSIWDDDSKGPRRRVYRLLPEGQAQLGEWMDNLESLQGRIQIIKDRYQAVLEEATKR